MTAEIPIPEITELIVEAGGTDLLRCMQCGTCTGVCPWAPLRRYSPRHVLRLASLGLEGYEAEDIWTCVTCGHCVARCPREIDIIEVLRSVRAVLQESGGGPRSYRQALGSLRAEGNPLAGERAERGVWAERLGLPGFDERADLLLFACCMQVYDARNRRAAEALVRVLGAAGVALGTLEPRLSCCGDQARRVGAMELADDLRDDNLEVMRAHGVARLVAASPHCLLALDAPADGSASGARVPERVHHSQLIGELLATRKLVPQRRVERRVTFHDPCYLGRHLGEYEAPRAVLRAIPGLDLVEMPRNRADSLCCGGGGGGAWMEVPSDERFAVLRVEEAIATGATVLATACPYCTTMLEDAVKVLDREDDLEVMDLAELVALSLPDDTPAAPEPAP